jgi:hypothetical protein
MAHDDRRSDRAGQTSATTALIPGGTNPTHDPWTPDLAVVTSTLDPVFQTLSFGHERYPAFRMALTYQDEWDFIEHLGFWQTHLPLWPLRPVKLPTTGLKARRAAVWLREGYSQSQIARALGYKPGNEPNRLWILARDYLDWLRGASKIRPTSLDAVAELEEMYAEGAEIAAGRKPPSERPYALKDPQPTDAEEARRFVRRKWRCPRVVTVDEWEREPYGWPKPISERLVYGEVDLGLIERAEQRLREQTPHHGRPAPAKYGVEITYRTNGHQAVSGAQIHLKRP